jgi:hypothetical protein
MPSGRLVNRMRLHQIDAPLGHRRQPRVVTVKHIQLRLGEIFRLLAPSTAATISFSLSWMASESLFWDR